MRALAYRLAKPLLRLLLAGAAVLWLLLLTGVLTPTELRARLGAGLLRLLR